MFRGILFGLVVSVIGFGVASLMLGPVEMTPIMPEQIAAPAMQDDMGEGGESPEAVNLEPTQPLADESVPQSDAGEDSTPPDTEAVEPEDAEASPGMEGAGTPDGQHTVPIIIPSEPADEDQSAAEPELGAEADMPTADSPESTEADAGSDMAEPAEPVSPEAMPSDADDRSDSPAADMPEGAEDDGDTAAPVEEGGSAAPAEADSLESAAPEGETTEAAPETDQDQAPEAADATPEPVQDQAPDMAEDNGEDDTGVVTSRLPRIGDEAAEPDGNSSPTLEPVPPLASTELPGGNVDGVTTGRLPTISAPTEDSTDQAAMPVDLPLIEKNAIPFAVNSDQPLLSLLLVDTGDGRAAMRDLDKLPFPVTVAVNAAESDAADAIDFYRGKGAEVAVIVPLPEGANATDVEVNLEAYAPLLDQAVAAMAEPEAGFQTLGDGAVQFGTHLATEGLGLVTFPSGLNTGHKAALKEGAHAGLVFRDLDSEGQSGDVIRRFLDNAAFRARNQNGVIVVARTRTETVQALLEWSLGNRAQSVTLAPLSAVLLEK